MSNKRMCLSAIIVLLETAIKIFQPLRQKSDHLPYLWSMVYVLKISQLPSSFASRPTVHFSDNLSASGIVLQYTRRLKGFICEPIKTQELEHSMARF